MSPLRRVRSLRLRAPSGELARRAVPLVEDALRTASIPDADGGRVYVVRRLSLPPLRPTASSNAIALTIERRLASLRTSAVHASDPRAARADVVYFDDESDVHAGLVRTLARFGSADAWFWRSVEPASAPTRHVPERVRAALLRLAATTYAAAALPRLLADAVSEGWIDGLLDAVRPEDGPALLHGMTADGTPAASMVSAADVVGPLPADVIERRWLAVIGPWSARWGGDDARAVWLAAAAIVAGRPAWIAAPRRLASVALHLSKRAAAQPSTSPISAARSAAARPSPTLPPVAQPSDVPTGADPSIDRRPSEAHADHAVPRPAHAPPVAEARTTAGGLLFMVQLLRRLQFDAFLDSHPGAAEVGLGAEILRTVACRTGTPPDDPVLDALGITPADDRPPPTSPAAREWIRAARAYSRRTARIGLHALVRRPATLTHTRTHIDLTFALRTADVRLRRAGLDLDPGWVPWLGRVVLFHYGERVRP